MDRKVKIWLVLAILIAALIAGFLKINGLRSDLIFRENLISAKYQSNQSALSSYVLGYKESLAASDRSADKLGEVLLDAIHGRYDSGRVDDSLFAAIREASPQINLDSYNRILDFIAAKREMFRAEQSELLDMVRNYESIRRTDLLDSLLAGWLGFPSPHLNARIGNDQLTGQAALIRIKLIVIDDTTIKLFSVQEMMPIQEPPIANSPPLY